MAFKVFIGHSVAPRELGIVYAMAIRQQNERAGMAKCRELAEKSGINIPQKILKRLARFMEFHFEARYPKEQKKFYKKCTKEFTSKPRTMLTHVAGTARVGL